MQLYFDFLCGHEKRSSERSSESTKDDFRKKHSDHRSEVGSPKRNSESTFGRASEGSEISNIIASMGVSPKDMVKSSTSASIASSTPPAGAGNLDL